MLRTNRYQIVLLKKELTENAVLLEKELTEKCYAQIEIKEILIKYFVLDRNLFDIRCRAFYNF
jgi:hypothetical protein